MKALLNRTEARNADRDAVQQLGLPTLALMENAGAFAAREIAERFSAVSCRPCILGGTGQNGGDGWVVARHLAVFGFAPTVVLVGDEKNIQGDAATMWTALTQMGVAAHSMRDEVSQLREITASASILVDALFGTGLSRPIEGTYAEAISCMNAFDGPVIALDLPSGIDADTGAILGCAVRATLTLTFAGHKRGLHQYPGVECAGEIVCGSIGVPIPRQTPALLCEPSDVPNVLVMRRGDSHKGTAGHVAVFAGSPGHTGAALLSGVGALRGGAGLVTLVAPEPTAHLLSQNVVELMTHALPRDTHAALEQALHFAERKSAAVLGPGSGLDSDAQTYCRRLIEQMPVPMVVDADALTAAADDLTVFHRARAPRILTPHPGEAARLLGTNSQDVQANRFAAAEQIARNTRCIVVLKGARTVVAHPDGRMRVCGRGTPALGVAGTGDVLSGVIAAQLGQMKVDLDVVAAAVMLHAMAGELAAKSDRGLLAHEVADALPLALEKCRNYPTAGPYGPRYDP